VPPIDRNMHHRQAVVAMGACQRGAQALGVEPARTPP
jgi:hypothetical protein